MIRFRPVLYVSGFLISLFGLFMLLPAVVDFWVGNPGWMPFLYSSVVTQVIGAVMYNAGLKHSKAKDTKLNLKEAFLLTAIVWIMVAALGALPFMFDTIKLSFTDAFFESMSGITTTGATVIVGLEHQQLGLLLWRGLLQGIGGIGFITAAISILPMLKVGGMQIFQLESSDKSEKLTPRISQIAKNMMAVYCGLIIACTIMLCFADLSFFDAFVHAMTAVSTGGFGNYDASVGVFDSPAVEWILVFFMFCGGLPFLLLAKFFAGDIKALLNNGQVKGFFGTVVGAIFVMFIYYLPYSPKDINTTFREVVFNVVSNITSTGFITTDYSLWGGFAMILFIYLMMMGGCAGSTSGGIKIFRLQILFSTARAQVRRLLQPHGVFTPYYARKPVPEDVSVSVMGFLYIFVLTYVIATLGMSFLGFDLVTALSAVAACIANVGPGLGEIVGPNGNFSSLPDAAKWLLSATMLLGRLEFFTIIVLFTPAFWRD